MRSAVVNNGVLLVAELALLKDTLIEFFQVILGKAVVLKEFLNLVVDVLGEAGALVAVLDLELVDEEALELLPLLDVKQPFPACIALTRFGCRRPVLLGRHTNCLLLIIDYEEINK